MITASTRIVTKMEFTLTHLVIGTGMNILVPVSEQNKVKVDNDPAFALAGQDKIFEENLGHKASDVGVEFAFSIGFPF